MGSERNSSSLRISSITVTWNVENIWELSFDGASSEAFQLSDKIFHLYMRRYELSIAIYLCRDDAIPAVMPILCRLCMLDQVGQETLIGEKEVVIENEKEFVLLQSVMIDDLEEQKEKFLFKDTLTISCSLSLSYRVNLMKQLQVDSSTQHVINRFETLSSDLENFYKSKKNTDAFLVAENIKFPVHRAIIEARSPELASMLQSESSSVPQEIPNLPASVLENILYYIYTGKIRVLDSGSVIQILAAANRFSFPELKDVCIKFLRSSLSEDTVFEAAAIACENNDVFLKDEVQRYLVKHIETILPTQRWKTFCTERYKFANEILTSVLLRMQRAPGKEE